MQRGFSRSRRCKPLTIPNATHIRQWRKQITMSIQWRNFLETMNHSPWFCWQAERFIWLSKEFKRRYVGVLKCMYSCWLRIRINVWTCARISQVMKCHSTDCVQYNLTHLPLTKISSEPLFFLLHTHNSSHNCVLLQRQVELKLQGIIFAHPGNAQTIQT